MAGKWALPRALMGGTAAMRAAGEAYLPKEPAEGDKAYKNRLDRSTLFNAFARTLNGMTGKVFSKPIVLAEDVPEAIAAQLEDADLAGRNIDQFARDVFLGGGQTGISHILVDMPPGEAPKNRADEIASGRRPYFVHIKAEDLIGWRVESIAGRDTLTQIRFREHATVDDGEYGQKVEERIRVLWRDRYEVWTKQDKADAQGNQYALTDEGAVTLGEIPLATYYANRTGFMCAKPPLEDLAYLNVAHWQSSSDQRHILHVARVPILFGRNLTTVDEDGKPIEIGPNRMITSSDQYGDLKYVEHGGQAITAGRDDLKDIEDRMRVMGLEVYMPQTSGNTTATGKAIDSAEQNSLVKNMALNLKDTLEQALVYMAKWQRLGDSGGSLTVNTDFLAMTAQTAQDVANLITARQNGEISRETFWSELKRRGVLADDFDPEAEEARLLEEDVNTLMPDNIDPETGQPIDPKTGLPVDPGKPPQAA